MLSSEGVGKDREDPRAGTAQGHPTNPELPPGLYREQIFPLPIELRLGLHAFGFTARQKLSSVVSSSSRDLPLSGSLFLSVMTLRLVTMPSAIQKRKAEGAIAERGRRERPFLLRRNGRRGKKVSPSLCHIWTHTRHHSQRISSLCI